MSIGWLTPNAIKQTDGTYKIKSDGDALLPQWTFPNSTGVVQLTSSAGVLPTAEAVTISAGGTITPAIKPDQTIVVSVSGAGGLADDLDSIVAPAAWVGKYLVVKMAGAGTITVKNSAALVIGSNCTLDSVYDRLTLECVAVDTWVQVSRSTNA